MSKKKLLVILGAGSSVSCGMPDVSQIDGEVKKWAAAVQIFPFRNYFQFLWGVVERYYSCTPYNHNFKVNFEKILGEMIALASWVAPSPYGNLLHPAVRDGGLVDDSSGDHDHMLQRQVILQQEARLLVKLARYIRARSKSLDTSTLEFKKYRRLISALRDAFNVGVYNLNYDTVAISAWPKAFTGFNDTGCFSPDAVLRRKKWKFIYHLHGSVHHSLKTEYGPEIVWKDDLRKTFFDGGHASAVDTGSNQKSLPQTSLIAGGFKLDQLLKEPFQSFYASLVRHVHEADAVLIGGYGFGDVHVNRALRNRLARGGNRPPVMVLTKSDQHAKPTGMHEDPGAWSGELKEALAARFPDDPLTPEVGSHLQDLVRAKSFEKALDCDRVAIWHGGFIEASVRLDNVVGWLS